MVELPTPPPGRRSAGSSTLTSASRGPSASSHTNVGMWAAGEITQPKPALEGPRPLSEDRKICTPLRRSSFERELANHPDKAWVSWLLDVITNGVQIGYNGPQFSYVARNLVSALQHPVAVEEELRLEMEAGRVHGPFLEPPLPNFRTSGLGVVPKKNGKWRVILHLSAPAGVSINDSISKEEYTLHYISMDDAVKMVHGHGPAALMAKIDLKSAFRMVPVHPDDWNLLGMCWKGKFYMDTCLPFGLRSSPHLFNHLAEAIMWILQNNYFVEGLHYLDDFLLVGPAGQDHCQNSVQAMLSLCSNLGVPVAMDKLEGPASTLTFLGITLDTVNQELRLPPEKLKEISQAVTNWLGRRTATKRELLSLIGRLAFAARVVPAGRLFCRRLIQLSTSVDKLHHHVYLNAETREDLKWWHDFLPSWNGKAMFIDPVWKDADDLSLYTDASGALGFGGYFQGSWFRGDWSPSQRLPLRSIQWQELFAIVAAATIWGSRLSNHRITFKCDNLAIVNAWSSQNAKDLQLSKLLRRLFFIAASQNFTVRLVHIPGSLNCIADCLSRNQLLKFFHLAPQADRNPTPVPPDLAEL